MKAKVRADGRQHEMTTMFRFKFVRKYEAWILISKCSTLCVCTNEAFSLEFMSILKQTFEAFVVEHGSLFPFLYSNVSLV